MFTGSGILRAMRVEQHQVYRVRVGLRYIIPTHLVRIFVLQNKGILGISPTFV